MKQNFNTRAHYARFKTPLERFVEKCAFDPYTGCVMWIGGTTSGQGHNEPYGRFWNGERMVYAHRWSAEHIHGFDVTGLQVDHNCPVGPSTLCVEHVNPETSEVNRILQATRPGRAFQDLETRRYWIHVQVGLEPLPPRERMPADAPVFLPPAWLRSYMPDFKIERIDDGIPF
jgi:hypothetical protein